MKRKVTPQARKPIIAVCGAALGDFLPEILGKAYTVGKTIAQSGAIILTGATTGYPYASAQGATEAGGLSIGVSPAKSYHDHVENYKKPVNVFDPIIFTGLGFFGRNPILVLSSQAVVFIDGGTGSLNELTVAYESAIPIGILKGSGGLEKMIPAILKYNYKKPKLPIISETDPQKLVQRLLQTIK